jgi:hypothetical protein
MSEEQRPQPVSANTYFCTTQLRHDVLMHPQYPRLSSDIRLTVEQGGSLALYGLMYHDFLSATYVYLQHGINYRLPNGSNLFTQEGEEIIFRFI